MCLSQEYGCLKSRSVLLLPATARSLCCYCQRQRGGRTKAARLDDWSCVITNQVISCKITFHWSNACDNTLDCLSCGLMHASTSHNFIAWGRYRQPPGILMLMNAHKHSSPAFWHWHPYICWWWLYFLVWYWYKRSACMHTQTKLNSTSHVWVGVDVGGWVGTTINSTALPIQTIRFQWMVPWLSILRNGRCGVRTMHGCNSSTQSLRIIFLNFSLIKIWIWHPRMHPYSQTLLISSPGGRPPERCYRHGWASVGTRQPVF